MSSRVCQRCTEVLSNVGLKNGVEVLELSVSYKSNYEHLSEKKHNLSHELHNGDSPTVLF